MSAISWYVQLIQLTVIVLYITEDGERLQSVPEACVHLVDLGDEGLGVFEDVVMEYGDGQTLGGSLGGVGGVETNDQFWLRIVLFLCIIHTHEGHGVNDSVYQTKNPVNSRE